jgi:hypothetical protein
MSNIKKNKTSGKKKGGDRKTRKRGSKISNKTSSHIVKIFLEVLNMVKLYHWKTRSYSQHKATDELYENLNKNIDSFIEVLLGKEERRIKMLEKRIELIDPSNTLDFKTRIYDYREFLIDINLFFDNKKDTDLLSIRDEILVNINQFLYLMTFDK